MTDPDPRALCAYQWTVPWGDSGVCGMPAASSIHGYPMLPERGPARYAHPFEATTPPTPDPRGPAADVLRWHYRDHPQVEFEKCQQPVCVAAVAATTPTPDPRSAGLTVEQLAAALDRILGEVIVGRYALLTPTEVANGVFALCATKAGHR